MSAVYEAIHVKIGRPVAIKVLHRSLASDADVVARFVNEARAVGTFGHPNIVASTDFGELPGGIPFLVLEYLSGRTLAEEIAALGRLEIRRVVRLGVQVASALDAAHARGVVHRDLTSENIFLTAQDGIADHVKVLDFGISKFLSTTDTSPRTRRGLTMGTPEFMAPEQIADPQAVDSRVDIYALGVILYQMLAGQTPFGRLPLQALLTTIVLEAPPPIDRSDLPDGLRAIVERALVKNPGERYATMRQLGLELEQLGSLLTAAEALSARMSATPVAELAAKARPWPPSGSSTSSSVPLTSPASPMRRPGNGVTRGGALVGELLSPAVLGGSRDKTSDQHTEAASGPNHRGRRSTWIGAGVALGVVLAIGLLAGVTLLRGAHGLAELLSPRGGRSEGTVPRSVGLEARAGTGTGTGTGTSSSGASSGASSGVAVVPTLAVVPSGLRLGARGGGGVLEDRGGEAGESRRAAGTRRANRARGLGGSVRGLPSAVDEGRGPLGADLLPNVRSAAPLAAAGGSVAAEDSRPPASAASKTPALAADHGNDAESRSGEAAVAAAPSSAAMPSAIRVRAETSPMAAAAPAASSDSASAPAPALQPPRTGSGAIAIQAVVRSRLFEVRRCYERGKMDEPELKGRVTLTIEIPAAGGVGSALVESSSLANSRVEECIVDAVRGWPFPAPANGRPLVISYPFNLR